jgi:hypothetical protein
MTKKEFVWQPATPHLKKVICTLLVHIRETCTNNRIISAYIKVATKSLVDTEVAI